MRTGVSREADPCGETIRLAPHSAPEYNVHARIGLLHLGVVVTVYTTSAGLNGTRWIDTHTPVVRRPGGVGEWSQCGGVGEAAEHVTLLLTPFWWDRGQAAGERMRAGHWAAARRYRDRCVALRAGDAHDRLYQDLAMCLRQVPRRGNSRRAAVGASSSAARRT